MERILFVQQQKIHIARKQLGLTSDQYDDLLSGFKHHKTGEKIMTSVLLTREQADILLGIFEKLGWEPKKTGKKLKYSDLDNRGGDWPSSKSLRLIDAKYHTSPGIKDKSEKGFKKFLKTVTGKSEPSWLKKTDITKLIAALKNYA